MGNILTDRRTQLDVELLESIPTANEQRRYYDEFYRNEMIVLGKNMERIRDSQRHSFFSLAHATDNDKSTITRFVNGERTTLPLDKIAAIAKYYGASVDEFLLGRPSHIELTRKLVAFYRLIVDNLRDDELDRLMASEEQLPDLDVVHLVPVRVKAALKERGEKIDETLRLISRFSRKPIAGIQTTGEYYSSTKLFMLMCYAGDFSPDYLIKRDYTDCCLYADGFPIVKAATKKISKFITLTEEAQNRVLGYIAAKHLAAEKYIS